MDLNRLTQIDDFSWRVEPHDRMRVPVIFYADVNLIRDMDDKVYEQACNVTTLPGIVGACYCMPDAHWGYGFPIGGVAAFDAENGGVISAGGVGFDISCGVRTLLTGLTRQRVETVKEKLADSLYRNIPAGVGSTGNIYLDNRQMNAMLSGGARWALEQGWGRPEDMQRIEENGCMVGAEPGAVSAQAKKRQNREMGTLGSGNHYLEIQHVTDVFDEDIAAGFGIRGGEVVISIHCGSRGLGHQIGTEYLREMVASASDHGIMLPDRELACAPIHSDLGKRYLGAMRAAINCALANRQIVTHLVRDAFSHVLPEASLGLLYDVSHNTCKEEVHLVDGEQRKLYVHRKGATRAFGPGHAEVPAAFAKTGQPVLIGGSMGTSSFILAGKESSEASSLSSACHGAGRAMSRRAATRKWSGRHLVDDLAGRGIIIRSPSMRGVAEEAPDAYKDVTAVVDAAQAAGLATKVARLEPLVCIKG